jgi:hypothetical protein
VEIKSSPFINTCWIKNSLGRSLRNCIFIAESKFYRGIGTEDGSFGTRGRCEQEHFGRLELVNCTNGCLKLCGFGYRRGGWVCGKVDDYAGRCRLNRHPLLKHWTELKCRAGKVVKGYCPRWRVCGVALWWRGGFLRIDGSYISGGSGEFKLFDWNKKWSFQCWIMRVREDRRDDFI